MDDYEQMNESLHFSLQIPTNEREKNISFVGCSSTSYIIQKWGYVSTKSFIVDENHHRGMRDGARTGQRSAEELLHQIGAIAQVRRLICGF